MESNELILQQRSMVRFLCLKGARGTEIHHRLEKVLRTKNPCFRLLGPRTFSQKEWIEKIKGQVTVKDANRSGRSSVAVTEENEALCVNWCKPINASYCVKSRLYIEEYTVKFRLLRSSRFFF